MLANVVVETIVTTRWKILRCRVHRYYHGRDVAMAGRVLIPSINNIIDNVLYETGCGMETALTPMNSDVKIEGGMTSARENGWLY
jgi:hypothetical protein